MNLLLFTNENDASFIKKNTEQYNHILKILKMGPGDKIYLGLIDGKISHSTIRDVSNEGIYLDNCWIIESSKLLPIELVVGIPRPQTAKKILFECTAIGVSVFHFISTDKGEKSYAKSKLWEMKEFQTSINLGLEQSFSTHQPKCYIYESVNAFLNSQNSSESHKKIVLDNYASGKPLGEIASLLDERSNVIVAIGSERGWSVNEIKIFVDYGYSIAHLGKRVLRCETVCVASCGFIATSMKLSL